MDGIADDPPRVEVPVGEVVRVRLVSAGSLRHDLTLPGGGESPAVPPGEPAVVDEGGSAPPDPDWTPRGRPTQGSTLAAWPPLSPAAAEH